MELKGQDNEMSPMDCIKLYMIYALFLWLIYCKTYRHISRVSDLPYNTNYDIWVSGRVTWVCAGDSFKFCHELCVRSCIMYLCSLVCNARDPELPIRLAGIDVPKSSLRRIPSQRHSARAKAHLMRLVLDKKVTLKLITTDRYNRSLAVCFVKQPSGSLMNVNLELVKLGLARIYRGPGAEYDEMLHDLEAAELNARNEKLGIWT